MLHLVPLMALKIYVLSFTQSFSLAANVQCNVNASEYECQCNVNACEYECQCNVNACEYECQCNVNACEYQCQCNVNALCSFFFSQQ